MKFRKTIVVLLSGIVIIASPLIVNAQEISNQSIDGTQSSVAITPFSDSIVTKYRTYKKKRQYRRWNVYSVNEDNPNITSYAYNIKSSQLNKPKSNPYVSTKAPANQYYRLKAYYGTGKYASINAKGRYTP